MQFLCALDVEDAEVRPFSDDAPEMLPFAGTLEVLRFGAFLLAQIPNHVPVRGVGYDDVDLDLKDHVPAPSCSTHFATRSAIRFDGIQVKLRRRLCPRRLPVERSEKQLGKSV